MEEGYAEHRSEASVSKDEELRTKYGAPNADELSEVLSRLSELKEFTKADMFSRMQTVAARKGPSGGI